MKKIDISSKRNVKITNNITLTDGEVIMINGMPINNELLYALDDIFSTREPIASVETIGRDIINCLRLREGDKVEFEPLSEETIFITTLFMALLTKRGLLENSLKS